MIPDRLRLLTPNGLNPMDPHDLIETL